ncbi:MAG: sigma-70 family RNA polymerase sigma factor [Proteobacteria bacterium]|jgi:RNA polymerase sigma factor for flagellar operon FliA|nr:sigma-70 family RNA polymerase sigma factor [Pseudomonadota bacterium]
MATVAARIEKNKMRPPIDEQLVRQHLPLVQRLARRMALRAPASVVADDLVSAGTYGLIDSVIRNRGGGGASFACYVRMRIRGAIYDELRANDWLPRRARLKDRPEPESGPPRPVAVIRFDDLSQGSEAALESTELDADPYEVLVRKRVQGRLHEALDDLPERDRLVVHLHYFKGMQVREIGKLLGVSEARISQIHHRALSRIRPFVDLAA